jgi:hypothetical protein
LHTITTLCPPLAPPLATPPRKAPPRPRAPRGAPPPRGPPRPRPLSPLKKLIRAQCVSGRHKFTSATSATAIARVASKSSTSTSRSSAASSYGKCHFIREIFWDWERNLIGCNCVCSSSEVGVERSKLQMLLDCLKFRAETREKRFSRLPHSTSSIRQFVCGNIVGFRRHPSTSTFIHPFQILAADTDQNGSVRRPHY